LVLLQTVRVTAVAAVTPSWRGSAGVLAVRLAVMAVASMWAAGGCWARGAAAGVGVHRRVRRGFDAAAGIWRL